MVLKYNDVNKHVLLQLLWRRSGRSVRIAWRRGNFLSLYYEKITSVSQVVLDIFWAFLRKCGFKGVKNMEQSHLVAAGKYCIA